MNVSSSCCFLVSIDISPSGSVKDRTNPKHFCCSSLVPGRGQPPTGRGGVVLLPSSASAQSDGTAMPRPIIIDTDPGTDDAVAILLALASPELEVLSLVAVAGNRPLAMTERNARAILELAGRPDIP